MTNNLVDLLKQDRDDMKELEHIFESMIKYKLFGDMYNLLEMVKETAPQVYEKYHKLGREAMEHNEILKKYPI
jgi:hypothetical protein